MSSRAVKRKRSQKVKSKCKEVCNEMFDNLDETFSKDIPRKKKVKKSNYAKNVRKQQLLEANEDEDKTIKRLENLLNLKKRKNKKLPLAFKEDGLNYLLEAIDGGGILSDDSADFEADVAALKGESKQHSTKQNALHSQPKQRTLAELLNEKKGNTNSKQRESDNVNSTDKESDEMNQGSSDSEAIDSDGNMDESDHESDSPPKKAKKSNVWEDIYGRLRDESGNVLKKPEASNNTYIPPKLRKRNATTNDESKSEECMRIKRNFKGLLNRLSESNLQNICHQIEDMYMKYSRNDMNETLFSLMTELLFASTLTPPRLMMEQTMLIALLHANIGSEVGAYFLQRIVEKLGTLFKSKGSYGEGKECNNILNFLSHLYNYKVTHSTLIFDIFHILVQTFDSKDIELIQLFLKNIGFVLRKDNPLKLKELVLAIQAKAASFDKDHNDSRVKFMLETLTAIRNNNMYKIPDYDPSIMEHSKKFLRGIIRKGCSIQELSISYEDLLKAKERGRWWIVGSAWAESGNAASNTSNSNDKDAAVPKSVFSERILELARKQHMNTEVRKSVFCIIMTAEDFMDAFEKLLKLNLNNQQEREIIHVILHCTLQEKVYNPYYAHLVEKFCSFARKHQMCLQFSLWDKFKEISKMKSNQLNNLSCLLSHLFTRGALPLSVLKVIHFSDMDKLMVRFFRQILLAILLHNSEEVCIRAFARIAQAEKLKLLRESLRLFMHHFVLKNQSKLEPDAAVKLEKRVKLAENAMKPPKCAF